MSLLSLLFKQLRVDGLSVTSEVRQLLFDVNVAESPSYRNRLTTNPIESGSSINDHVIDEPDTLSLQGIVSDTPVRVLSGIRDLVEKGFGSSSRSSAAFDVIRQLQTNKELVTVVTGLTVYSDMMITSFNPTRSAGTGKSLQFSMELQKVRRVTSRTVKNDKIRDAHPGTKTQIQSATDAGKQATKAADTGTAQGSSVLFQLLQGAGVIR